MPKLFKNHFFWSFITSLLSLGLIISFYVFGWTLPSSIPPSNNLNSPINTSSNNQYKIGYLAIGTSTAPSFPLDVAGVVRVGRYSSAPSGANGAIYYDTTINKFRGYQNGAWSDLGGANTEIWIKSGNNIYYNSGKVGIGTSTPLYILTVTPPTDSAYDISICKNAVCCPIWKDCDGDGKTYGSGDCDESCSTCYVGSMAYTTSPDGKDQDCDGVVDEVIISSPFTLIWVSNTTHDGNLGKRAGADNFCQTDAPLNLPVGCSTSTIHAFLCAQDDLASMPNNYGYPSSSPLKWFNRSNGSLTTFANNWNDALDETIIVSQQTGTGNSASVFTGCNANGTSDSFSTCYLDNISNPWMSNDSGMPSRLGSGGFTGSDWLYLSGSYYSCYSGAYVRCAIFCNSSYQ